MTLLVLRGNEANQLRYEQGTNIVVPDIYYFVAYGAFRGDLSDSWDPLTSVALPDSVYSIDDKAFWENDIKHVDLG